MTFRFQPIDIIASAILLGLFAPAYITGDGVVLAITGIEIAALVGAAASVYGATQSKGGGVSSPFSHGTSAIFNQALGGGFGLLDQLIRGGGLARFQGPLSAGLGTGEQDVLNLLPRGVKALGGFLDPEFGADLMMRFEEARRPFVERQIELGKASARESEALGGTTFSTGRIERENRLVSDIFASEQAQAAPLAAQLSLQAPQLQLGATSQLGGLLGFAGLPRQVEQDRINRELAEFIRTDPSSLLPYIVSLASGAPSTTTGPNAWSQAAPALAGLSGGLMQMGASQQQNEQMNALVQALQGMGLGTTGSQSGFNPSNPSGG